MGINKDFISGVFTLGIPLGMVGMTILQIPLGLTNYIPQTEKVQQGYIAPKNIKIKCEDLDQNGEPETVMKIGNKSYLLREVDGRPVLSEYKIEFLDH